VVRRAVVRRAPERAVVRRAVERPVLRRAVERVVVRRAVERAPERRADEPPEERRAVVRRELVLLRALVDRRAGFLADEPSATAFFPISVRLLRAFLM
jgi:hypothetical protein